MHKENIKNNNKLIIKQKSAYEEVSVETVFSTLIALKYNPLEAKPYYDKTIFTNNFKQITSVMKMGFLKI